MSNFEDLIRIKTLEKELYDVKNKLSFLERANDNLIEQKKQLKVLLKECIKAIEEGWMYYGIPTPKAKDLLTKIDNAIGEKK